MSNAASKLHEENTAELPSETFEGISSKTTNSNSANLSLVKETANVSQPLVRNKVLTRKRKRSKHPLREIRIRSGCTLEELSEVTKMSPSYLSRLESGSRRLNADIIQRLSLALGCNPAELLPYNNFTGTSYAAPNAGPATSTASVDLPVYTLKGISGEEAVLESARAEQWIMRPADFMGVSDAFACAVDNSQWAPRYMSGDRLLVHPTAPLKEGCSVIVTTNDNKTFIGAFKGIEGQGNSQEFKIETSFSKDVKAISFKQKDIKAYRITGTLDAA